MKTQNLFLFVTMIAALNIHIANCQPYWQWGGDQINSSITDYIGTTNRQNFDIRTNGQFRMRVDSTTGWVLIANQAIHPANSLHLFNSGTSTSVIAQISNGNTNHPNGLRFGINSSNEGVINM